MSISDTPVRLVMSDPVLCIVPDVPLKVALRMMAEAGVRHLPVTAGGRCVGLLHESDVLWQPWSTAGRDPAPSGAVARTPIPLLQGRIAGIVTTTNAVWLPANLPALPNQAKR